MENPHTAKRDSPPEKPPAPTPWWRRAAAPAILFLCSVLLYAPSSRFGFLYDDNLLIVCEEAPQSLRDTLDVFAERHWYNLPYYRPVARLTMVLQKFFHGNNPAPFHLFNTLVMACLGLMAYGMLRLRVFHVARPIAGLAAALLAAHPVASSCVYPISSGRETLIPALFIMGCVYVFLRGGRAWLPSAVALYVLALLSKEQAVVVPGLLVAADVLHLSPAPPGRDLIRWVRRYIPFLGVTLLYFVVRWKIVGGAVGEHSLELVKHPEGPFLSVLYTLQTIVLPYCAPAYEPRFEIWFSPWRTCFSLLVIVALAIGRLRSDRGHRRAFLFLAFWFALTLLPMANILHQEARFAERYAILPLFGAVAAASLLLVRSPMPRPLGMGVAVTCVAACAAVSLYRGQYYRDELAFLHRWREADPENAQAHLSLGDHYAFRGRHATAMAHYRESIKRNPNNPIAHSNLASALNALGARQLNGGSIEEGVRLIEEAITHYRAVIRLDPDYAGAHAGLARAASNLGTGKARMGQLRRDAELLRQAEAHFREVIQLDADCLDTHNSLAQLLAISNREEEALVAYREVIRLEPNHSAACSSIGVLEARRGRLDEGIEWCRKAVELDPSSADAHRNLAVVLQMQGNVQEAIRRLQDALQRSPQSPDLMNRLARIYATSDRSQYRNGPEAVRLAEKAAELTSFKHPFILGTLAAAYAQAGRFEDAVSTARDAIRLGTRHELHAWTQEQKVQMERYQSGNPYQEKPGAP